MTIVVPAFSLALPVPVAAALGGEPAQAIVAALAGGVQALLPPLATASLPQTLRPSDRTAMAVHHSALAASLAAGGGLVALSAVLFVAAQQLLPPLSPADWIPELPATPAADAEVPPSAAEAAQAPEAAPAPVDLAALEQALNTELQRAGLRNAQVRLDAAGVATAQGTVDSEDSRRMVLEWLQGQAGIAAVRDGLRLEVPAAPPAAPVPPAPPPRPPVSADIDRPAVAPPEARPRPDRNAPRIEPPVAVPAPPVDVRPPLADTRPPVPDAASVARSVQRELARLGLDDVTATVDPATLAVTLRGRTRDAARKAEALAAVRAVAPGGRVRDLVFVIEE